MNWKVMVHVHCTFNISVHLWSLNLIASISKVLYGENEGNGGIDLSGFQDQVEAEGKVDG